MLLFGGALLDVWFWQDKAWLTFVLGVETAHALLLSSMLWYRSAWFERDSDCNVLAAGYNGIAATVGAAALGVQLAPDGPVPTSVHVWCATLHVFALAVALLLVFGDPGRRPREIPAPAPSDGGSSRLDVVTTIAVVTVALSWLVRSLRKST